MSNYKFETLQLHVGQETADPATDSRAVPIYATTSYVFHDCAHAAARFGLADAGNIYGRLTNSTQEVFEKRIAALEGGVAALAVSSGAAAISYVLQALGQNGGHFVAQKTIYGGSYNLLEHTLPNFGITATFVNIHDLNEVEAAIQENTRAIYIETLGNPNSDIPDIDALAELAHKHGLPLVVDNTFGTPYLIRPIEHGANIVVHSATKFIGGHGTTLGGVIVDSGKFDWAASGKYPAIADPNPSYHGVSFVKAVGAAAFVTYIRAVLLRDTGACISPFAAFLLLQGTETLWARPFVLRVLFTFRFRVLADSLLYLAAPGHCCFQHFMGCGLSVIRQNRQRIEQVDIGNKPVGLGCFNHGIDYGTGLRSLYGIAEQPVLAAYRKRTDGILCQIVGDRNIAMLYKCGQRSFLVLCISHCLSQLAALFRIQRIYPAKILLQNR